MAPNVGLEEGIEEPVPHRHDVQHHLEGHEEEVRLVRSAAVVSVTILNLPPPRKRLLAAKS